MMTRMTYFAATAALGSLLASGAVAQSLTGSDTADNGFEAFVSTGDSTLGTYIGWGNNWQHSFSVSGALIPGVTNYLHIIADNQYGVAVPGSNPDAFLGDFAVTGNFRFSNGLQTLSTDATDWLTSPNVEPEQLYAGTDSGGTPCC